MFEQGAFRKPFLEFYKIVDLQIGTISNVTFSSSADIQNVKRLMFYFHSNMYTKNSSSSKYDRKNIGLASIEFAMLGEQYPRRDFETHDSKTPFDPKNLKKHCRFYLEELRKGNSIQPNRCEEYINEKKFIESPIFALHLVSAENPNGFSCSGNCKFDISFQRTEEQFIVEKDEVIQCFYMFEKISDLVVNELGEVTKD